jgi:ribosomal protein L12E/L44/L45/RPP1/RPP2
VKKDFVFALYQLIRRSGRIEIEPDWIEWLLDSIGLSKQNANIRIYIKQKKEKRNLIEQIVNCNQEISIFINLLLYLRIYKQKGFFF